ncbi:MAG: IS66 family insertion sequence element accessory protein TnpB [Magnetococcales bacterium]|nr:IS66 family insertion sequence element accessory protein TnpB [Magnetococcales bacterium]
MDFRKGINGLAAFVEAGLGMNPFGPGLFVFRNRDKTRIKILYWERNGFCLWQKRLEQDRFHWLRDPSNCVATITGQQLNWLLDGCDIARIKPHKVLNYFNIS